MNPQVTVMYIDLLVARGCPDSAMSLAHHFREDGRYETFARHREYCQQRQAFRHDSNNVRVQRRLAYILQAAGEQQHTPQEWEAFAEAAYQAILNWPAQWNPDL